MSYLTKAMEYLLKDVADSGGGRSERQEPHWSTLRAAALAYRCEKCQENGRGAFRDCFTAASTIPIGLAPSDHRRDCLYDASPLEDGSIHCRGLLVDHSTRQVIGDTADCYDCAETRRREF